MRSALAITFILILQPVLCQSVPARNQDAGKALSVELRASSNHVHLTDSLSVSVFFRSPNRRVTLWNSFGWGDTTGLSLMVMNISGKVLKEYAQMFDVMPPNETGSGELVSIGGNTFAGFDTKIQVKDLFPGPGTFTLKCVYSPPFPRNYFQGSTIWGKEDGEIRSTEVTVVVDK
jgi:hypothetical protein